MAAAKPKEPRRCARPGCPAVFVPPRKDQVYCSATCRGRVHAYRFALNGATGRR